MPQQILPIFSEGENSINEKVHYEYDIESDTVCYFHYCVPFYSHPKNDTDCLKMVIGQLIHLGHCRNSEIIKSLGVTKSYVDRAVKLYNEGGTRAFFTKRKVRGAAVLTPEVIAKAQQLLASGESRSDVANELGIKLNTLAKAIAAGHLIEKKDCSKKQKHP
jgi:hypothetical protein